MIKPDINKLWEGKIDFYEICLIEKFYRTNNTSNNICVYNNDFYVISATQTIVDNKMAYSGTSNIASPSLFVYGLLTGSAFGATEFSGAFSLAVFPALSSREVNTKRN